MKLSRMTALLLSLLTAAAMTVSFSVCAFAEGEPPTPSETDEVEPEVTDDPGDIEPEETYAPAETEPEETTAPAETTDDEINDIPAAVLDDDDAPAETTTPPETTAAAPLPEASYTPEAERTMYAPQVINIRTGPGTDYDKLGVLYANAEITVIGTSGEWVAVSYNGSTGYILRSLLSDTPATTTAAPETAPPPDEGSTPEEETSPAETAPTETEWQSPEMAAIVEPSETTAPIAFTPEETTTRSPLPASGVENADGGGFPPFLLALLAALAAFLLIGVLPIGIHRVHHKNLYRY
ncbi:MAG: SH3 domain-containing protein [Bacteroides sp.]|nr:SH3 domain-containing protein [Eubacterium sp.]MCM1418865.1 SH3 domain-containing protein [Roseburia sp.]MCM1463330.1 SH3 domain-containing protein [Bacteroides sp.]